MYQMLLTSKLGVEFCFEITQYNMVTYEKNNVN